jgi:hypothetical protein
MFGKVSLILIGFGIALAGAVALAQTHTQDPSLADPGQQLLAQPFVVAGPDVGFRVVRWDGQIPVGQVVVRINGAWVAAETPR